MGFSELIQNFYGWLRVSAYWLNSQFKILADLKTKLLKTNIASIWIKSVVSLLFVCYHTYCLILSKKEFSSFALLQPSRFLLEDSWGFRCIQILIYLQFLQFQLIVFHFWIFGAFVLLDLRLKLTWSLWNNHIPHWIHDNSTLLVELFFLFRPFSLRSMIKCLWLMLWIKWININDHLKSTFIASTKDTRHGSSFDRFEARLPSKVIFLLMTQGC